MCRKLFYIRYSYNFRCQSVQLCCFVANEYDTSSAWLWVLSGKLVLCLAMHYVLPRCCASMVYATPLPCVCLFIPSPLCCIKCVRSPINSQFCNHHAALQWSLIVSSYMLIDWIINLCVYRIHVWLICRFANVFMHKVNEDIAPGYHSIVHRLVKEIQSFLVCTCRWCIM